ncbi:hypothetical protein ACIBM8_24290 [Micromonospora aurantiaca]|uniref:hypothetical protein n=1 Tax=Micromonospora TaxID=1873 RepID=UPI00296E6F79|nr:hypothetical protein [Micromonospora sp. BRA006-A]MDW3848687.1 hypothetical protein [Micromonospora sp. BRA006-A]MEE3921261.1 hypothetical protein [Micromonospora sp. BRA006-A]
MTDTTPDHIPAHVKNSYVNCSEYTRAPRLTPPPADVRGDAVVLSLRPAAPAAPPVEVTR